MSNDTEQVVDEAKTVEALRIYLVDDEASQREILADILESAGYCAQAFATGPELLAAMKENPAQLVLTDLKMPVMDGLEVLAAVKQDHEGCAVLLMTAYGTVSSAIEAMKLGAFDYLQKPFDKDELLQRVHRVAERCALIGENQRLRRELGSQRRSEILGESSVARELRRRVDKIAKLPGDVLVSGESGTGKELVARALHFGSARAGGPFVALNCAAIPEGLAESELFGHMKGAFTHASSSRAGRFEQADGGTLFLDEVSAMPLPLQAKLLRVLQERVVERVGSDRPRKLDVRVVAATNLDLVESARAGTFREDLYHRLNVHEVWIPPLRERGEDVVLLAETFTRRAAERFGLPPVDLEPGLLDFFRSYPFPGNVRELEHMMEKMVALSDGDPLGPSDLPPSVRRRVPSARHADRSTVSLTGGTSDGTTDASAAGPSQTMSEDGFGQDPESLLSSGPVSLFDIEERLLKEAIRRSGGNLSEAARLLSISYKTMRYRARKFGLDE